MGAKKDFSFEEAMARLEEIVDALDGGEKPLDESMQLFEEGVRLAGICSKQLNEAQGKLETLVKAQDGSYKTQTLEF